MVSDIPIKKKGKLKKFLIFFLIALIILIIIALILGYLLFNPFQKSDIINNKNRVVLENPLKNIILKNTNEKGEINKEKVVEQAIIEFDNDYINYILIALGANKLYRSKIGYGNPRIELSIDEEVWSSEIVDNSFVTSKTTIENEDIIIKTSRKEMVESLLAKDIKVFMKDSVNSGITTIEVVAGKLELLSKGYLDMYDGLK